MDKELHDTGTRNWVKTCLALRCLKDVILPFLKDKCDEQYIKDINSMKYFLGLADYTCKLCKFEELKPFHSQAKQCKYINVKCYCACKGKHTKECPEKGSCGKLYDLIKDVHVQNDPNWSNTNCEFWSDKQRGPWERMKCFIYTPGYKEKAAISEADLTAFVQICINNDMIKRAFGADLDCLEKVRDIRNKVCHSWSMEVSPIDFLKYVKIVEDTLKLKIFDDYPSAKDELLKLHKLENESTVVTVENELTAREETLVAIRELKTMLELQLTQGVSTDNIEEDIKKLKTIEDEHKRVLELRFKDIERHMAKLQEEHTRNKMSLEEHKEILSNIDKGFVSLKTTVNQIALDVQEDFKKTLGQNDKVLQDLAILKELLERSLRTPAPITVNVPDTKLVVNVKLSQGDEIVSEMLVQSMNGVRNGISITVLQKRLQSAIQDIFTGGVELIDVKNECMALYIRFAHFKSWLGFLNKYLTGEISKAFKPVEEHLRTYLGCEQLELSVDVYEEDFEKCVQSIVYQLATTMLPVIGQGYATRDKTCTMNRSVQVPDVSQDVFNFQNDTDTLTSDEVPYIQNVYQKPTESSQHIKHLPSTSRIPGTPELKGPFKDSIIDDTRDTLDASDETSDETLTIQVIGTPVINRTVTSCDISAINKKETFTSSDEGFVYPLSRMTSLDGNQNEAYFLRLHMLVMEAQKVLRAKFDSIIKPADLTSTLVRVDGTLKKLNKSGILSKEQNRLLNPNPTSKNFDTTLLICLLQNICNLNSNDKVWAEKDNDKIKGNTDQENIQRIKNIRNKMQHKNVASLEQPEFESSWNILEKAMVYLGTSCGMQDVQNTINTIKTKTLDIVTPQMKSLRENTMVFLKEYQDDRQYYVATKFYHQADKMLKDKNLTVLTGNPGEGKTTMAAYLALERSNPENCLKLAHASHWRKVDWSMKLFNTVIIDDIFGVGSLNNTFVSEWKEYLPEIERAAKARRLNVIITSRHYIMEEALDELNNNSIFKDQEGSIVHLASDDLTHNEKMDILVSRAKRNATEDLLRQNDVAIDECVKKSNFVFGFPQCANLFVQNDKMIKLGAGFFENPEAHFKAYIEQLYNARDDDIFHKFIALVIVWAEQTGRIKADDVLNPAKTSEHIRYVANIFGIEVNRKFMENIRLSLKSHQKDFLIYIDHTGEYKFNHNVIGDMVGVVLGEPRHKLVETIELCPRDFLMDRICLDDKGSEQFRVVVGEDNFHHLCRKVAKMILRKDCNSIARGDFSREFQTLERRGPRSNTIEVLHDLDFGILKHPMFLNMDFVEVFMKVIKDDGLEQDIFQKPVMKMTGYFLDYGIRMNEMTMFIPGYTLYSNISILANALIENNFIQKDHTDPLLLAAHSGDIKLIQLLLSKGAKVSGDTIYVAMHKKRRPDQNCLKTILKYPGIAINDRGNAINGNYPIIVASRKDFLDAVKCMLENGADPKVQNDKKLTALHKAVIYKHTDIVQELLKHRAPLDIKGGKFKRTPLHIAADVGDMALAKLLLSKGANVEVKDHRGHYPIFLAAIRGHTPTVQALLQHHQKQDQLRIKSYGKASKIKGMSLFHVAVWKKDKDLMEMLIREKADPDVKDFFGQTALFCAIMNDCKPMIQLLLPYADKAMPQKQGYTPLHAAVFKGNAKTTARLAVSVDVNASDKYGRTPLHVACEKGDIQIAHLLLKKHKADHRMLTKRGDSVYHILRRKNGNKTNDEHCKRRLIEILISQIDPKFLESISNKSNRAGINIDEKTKLTANDMAVIRGLMTTLSIEKCEDSDNEEDQEQTSKGPSPKKAKTVMLSPDFLDSDDFDDNLDDDPLQYSGFGCPLDTDEYDDDDDF